MGTKALNHASGKNGRIFIGTALGPNAVIGDIITNATYELCVTEFDITELSTEVDTTNSCSSGKREQEYGLRHVEGNITMQYDQSEHPYDDPPNIVAGGKVCAILYEFSIGTPSTPDGGRWHFTAIGFAQVALAIPTDGLLQWTVPFKSSGGYFNPEEGVGSSGT